MTSTEDYCPPEVVANTALHVGEHKVTQSYFDQITKPILAGIQLGIGAMFSLYMKAGGPDYASTPFCNLLASGVFPLGLIMILFTGTELYTSDCGLASFALIRRKVSMLKWLKTIVFAFFMNYLGCFLAAYFICYLTASFDSAPVLYGLFKTIYGKATMKWYVALLRGIGANYLVNLAVWFFFSSKSAAGKILGIWWPITAFCAVGMEHSIANQFYFSLGALYKDFALNFTGDYADKIAHYASAFNWWDTQYKNILPAAIGNFLGGFLFCSLHWFRLIYKKGDIRKIFSNTLGDEIPEIEDVCESIEVQV